MPQSPHKVTTKTVTVEAAICRYYWDINADHLQ